MNKKIIIGLIAVILVICGLYSVYQANAYVSMDAPARIGRLVNYDFFASTTAPTVGSNATTTNATSTGIIPYFDTSGRYDNGSMNITGANRVTFYFSRTGGNSGNVGSSTFFVQVTPDGTNWYPFNKMVQNFASSTNPGYTIASQQVTGTSTVIDSLDIKYDTFKAVRCIVVFTVDGSSSCKASASF